jgi:hypothetical protein
MASLIMAAVCCSMLVVGENGLNHFSLYGDVVSIDGDETDGGGGKGFFVCVYGRGRKLFGPGLHTCQQSANRENNKRRSENKCRSKQHGFLIAHFSDVIVLATTALQTLTWARAA